MYYVIETDYVGPGQDTDQYIDAGQICISTVPARTNRSGESRTEGWCGTDNGWAVYAHGQYATVDEARDAIANIFGDVRPLEYVAAGSDDGVIEAYKPGKYVPYGPDATAVWAQDVIIEDIGPDTSDERIKELVTDYVSYGRDEGVMLDQRCLRHLMIERRAEMRDYFSAD